MDLFHLIDKMMVLNRDDGVVFTDTTRLDVISELLEGTGYQKVNDQMLFHMYAKKPLREMKKTILVSSHVDCEKNISKCFFRELDDNMIQGTFDNGLTNALILSLMLKGELPDDVIIAFTGDEEENGTGAKNVASFLKSEGKIPRMTVVLDATEEGWKTESHFTIENDFWDYGKDMNVMKQVISRLDGKWNFVPGDLQDIPKFIDKEKIIYVPSYDDESWDYDEEYMSCFSFCVPTEGEMHCDDGILARKESCISAERNLSKILCSLSELYS